MNDPGASRRYDTVTLLTDFGLTDEFVGVMHSVLHELAPQATVIDLTHGIAPYDVRAGSLALVRSLPYVAPGIVVAVVDPGVGTTRKAVAVEVADGAGVLVGPDNGLLAPAVAVAGGATRAVELDNAEFHLDAGERTGATFDGRDVFTPVAAHLCNGVDLAELGTPIDPALLLPGLVPLPRVEGDELHAEVLWVDRYGNCQLNVDADEMAAWHGPEPDVLAATFGEERRAVHLGRAFADLGAGTIGMLLDSHGMYALVLDQRSAAAELSLGVGDSVVLTQSDAATPDPAATAVTSPVELRRNG